MATKFRCCLVDCERISSVAIVESDDDAGALIKADRLLAASTCTAAEIWQGKRRVSILSRKAPAPSTPLLVKRQELALSPTSKE